MIPAILLAAAVNLLPNGDFSNGALTPEHWERADGLVTFWEKDFQRGRVAKLDSRIESKQAAEWAKTFKKNPAAAPPKPILAKPPYYSAIGGLEGTMLDSDLIDVEPGQNYKLTVDVKGDSKPFVWIKGFRKHPKRDMLIDSYQTRMHAYPLSKNEWKTFSIGFNPTAKMPSTTKMKVRFYVYWPVGICYFSNVRIEKITPQEMKRLEKERETADPGKNAGINF